MTINKEIANHWEARLQIFSLESGIRENKLKIYFMNFMKLKIYFINFMNLMY